MLLPQGTSPLKVPNLQGCNWVDMNLDIRRNSKLRSCESGRGTDAKTGAEGKDGMRSLKSPVLQPEALS